MCKNKLVQTLLFIFLGWSLSPISLADTIEIGIAGPFSGPYVAAGDQQWLGAIQAVEDINEHGGVNGKKLVLITADDDCDPKKAEKIARDFVKSARVMAVIGHNCSSTTLAASKIYAAANLLMITPASTTPEITEHNYPSIFRTCGRDDSQGEIAAYFMTNKLKAKKIAIVHDGSVYGKKVAENVKLALNKLGTKEIFYQEITHDNSNYSEQIKQISALEPDLIYFGGLQFDGGNFLKYLREHGNQTTFFGSDGIASPDFVQAAGGPNIVNGVYMTFFNDPLSIPEAKKVVKQLQEKRIQPSGYMLNSYAAVQAVEAALKNAPPDKMSDWLHQNKVNSVVGPLEWNQKGDLTKAPFIVYKWNDEGEYEPY